MIAIFDKSCYKVLGYGGVAVLFWSFSAYVICTLRAVSLLIFLSVTQIVGGLVGIFIEKQTSSLKALKTHIKTDWGYLLLLLVNFFTYPLALRSAPAAHVDLIFYIWPSLLICLELLRKKQKPSKLKSLGVLLCFVALFVLFIPDLLTSEVKGSYILGYVASIVGAFSWAIYCLFSNYYKRYDMSKTSLDIFLTGIFFAIAIFLFEPRPVVSFRSFTQLSLYGLVVFGLAFPLWSKASNQNHPFLLSMLASFIPVLSIFWLVVGGVVTLSFWVISSFALVLVGGVLTQLKSTKLRKKC